MDDIKYRRFIKGRPQLWWKENGQYCWTCLHDFRVDFEVIEHSIMRTNGNISLVHRKLSGISAPIGYGLKFSLRRNSESFDAMPEVPASSINLAYWNSASSNIIWGSKKAGNIASYDDHYANPSFEFEVDDLDAGFYRLEAWACSHSTAWPDGTNGLIEVNQNLLPNGDVDLVSAENNPYSYLTLRVSPK